MADFNDVSITFDIEPIVKVTCTNAKCRHNLYNVEWGKRRQLACNLKRIVIGNDGICENYIPLEQKENDDQS